MQINEPSNYNCCLSIHTMDVETSLSPTTHYLLPAPTAPVPTPWIHLHLYI